MRLEALREEMIAKAIAELDALQGDPDLEDEGEREDDDPREEDDPAEDSDAREESDPGEESDHGGGENGREDDAENTLGWSEGQSLRGVIKAGFWDEAEPSLASTDNLNQRRWGTHALNPGGRAANVYRDPTLDAEVDLGGIGDDGDQRLAHGQHGPEGETWEDLEPETDLGAEDESEPDQRGQPFVCAS